MRILEYTNRPIAPKNPFVSLAILITIIAFAFGGGALFGWSMGIEKVRDTMVQQSGHMRLPK